MYDVNGKWVKQKVYLGRTKHGLFRGLFTNGVLVYRVDEKATLEEVKQMADDNGFELVHSPDNRKTL